MRRIRRRQPLTSWSRRRGYAAAATITGTLARTEDNDTGLASGLHLPALPHTEDFTGTDSDPLPDTLWGQFSTIDGGLFEIRNNKASVQLENIGGSRATIADRGIFVANAVDDISVSFDWELVSDLPDLHFFFRCNTVSPFGFPEVNDGYVLVINTFTNLVGIALLTGGIPGAMGSATQAFTGTIGDIIHCKVETYGSLLRFTHWLDSDPEPPFVNWTDATHTGSTKRITGFGADFGDDTFAEARIDTIVYDRFVLPSITGTIAETEDNDAMSALGAHAIGGTLARTEADDTMAAAGTFTASGVTGTIAVTEANDTMAASGSSVVGSLARTEANDTSAAAGAHGVSGSIARTEANDTVVAAGGHGVSGSLARTEANDTMAAAGSSVSGTLARTEANDTSAIAAGHGPSGSLAETEDNDTIAAAGSVTSTGTINVTEQNDTSAATGTHIAPVTGTLTATEQNDTPSALGGAGPEGTLAVYELDDTMAASGNVPQDVIGTINVTEGDDVADIDGIVRTPRRAHRGWRGIKPKKWNHRYLDMDAERRKLIELLPEVDLSEPEVVVIVSFDEDEELMMLC